MTGKKERSAHPEDDDRLGEHEDHLRILSELTSDCCWVRWEYPDGTSRREWVSGSFLRLTGYEPEEFDRMGREKLIHPEDLDRALQHVEGPEGISELEFRIVRKDGEVRWLHERMHVIPCENGVTRVYGATRDMTERKHAEAALLESQAQLHQSRKMESLGMLAGGVAHDFNNLLTVILGYSDLLAGHTGADSREGRYAKGIRSAAENAASLTQQLLAFSRKQTLQPKVVEAGSLVRRTGAMLERLLPDNVRLELHLAGERLPVKVDPGQFEQVLVDLVVNARDAMPDGGTIIVETVVEETAELSSVAGSRCERSLRLRVLDDGCGMDEETRNRIFEPFFTTKQPGLGTGLGLAAVYGTIQQSGGRIEVRSTPGGGTEMTIRLPEAHGDTAHLEDGDEEQEPGTGSETILLVEDQAQVLTMVSETLAALGYRVLSAGGPAEAARVAREHHGAIDLLLTDVVMPEMNGRTLAERLRRDRPELRVLFMSGYSSEVMGRGGIVEPELEFIQKPFSAVALARRIRDILDAG